MNKRGVALEITIVFMAVLFLLCSLIFTLTLKGSIYNKKQNDYIGLKQEVEQVGDSFFLQVSTLIKDGHIQDSSLLDDVTLNSVYYKENELIKELTFDDDTDFTYYTLKLSNEIDNNGLTSYDLILKVTIKYDKVNEILKISEWRYDSPLTD